VPERVGNRQRVLMSDLSGRSNIIYKLKEQGLATHIDDAVRRELLERVKQMEYEGCDLEAADGTFELLVREALHPALHLFDIDSYKVEAEGGADDLQATASVTLHTQDGTHAATATGHGPFDVLHQCLRMCLTKAYPRIGDYKVRVLDARSGTASKVRVLIEWRDKDKSWCTVGVSDSVIEASWQALVAAVRLELMRLVETDRPVSAAGGAAHQTL